MKWWERAALVWVIGDSRATLALLVALGLGHTQAARDELAQLRRYEALLSPRRRPSTP